MPQIPQGLRDVIHDITSPRKRPWLLVAVGFVLVLAAWKNNLGGPRPPKREPNTIEYHYAQWLHHKNNLWWSEPVPRVSLRRLTWYLDGKPTLNERTEKIDRHELALIALDYFEQRALKWKGGEAGRFMTAFSQQAAATNPKLRWSATFFESQGTNAKAYFSARTEDMPAIESIIKQIERRSTNRW